MTEILHRAFPAGSTTLDIEARTVEVTFATEQPVRRRGWDGQYDEVLVVTAAAIDAGRMDAMSVLDSHRANSLADRIGSVVPGSLKIARGQASCTIKLSRSEKAQLLLQDLADGHSLPISVGYRIHEEKRTEAPSGGVATVRATKWEPLEISVVPIPADAGAKTRELENEGQENMTETVETTNEPRLTRAERNRKRQSEIRALARLSNVESEDFVRTALDGNTTVDQFRDEMLEFLIAREERAPTFPISTTRGMVDSQETTRTLMANGIMHRRGLTPKLEEGANQYRDMTMVDLARETLQLGGHNHRGPASDVVRRALHSTSDFPIILGDITRQTMMQAYAGQANTYQLIANRNVVPDLRDVKVLEIGSGPELEPVTESGEYKRGTLKESQESFSMAHYGKVIGLTEAMLINDQLGAFTGVIQSWAISAARLEGNIVWDVILSNMKLRSDNKTLFHADHGNIATLTGAPDLAKLEAARKAFRRQTDIDGQPIALAPQFLFTGTEHETTAQKLINSEINAQTFEAAVPQQVKNLTPVYEKRIDKLSDRAWFLFCSPTETFGRGLQYALLSGYETPRIMDRWGFDRDGYEVRIDHYFGAGLTDYRFAYYNNGIEPETP